MVDLTYQPQVQSEELPGRAYPRLPDELPAASFGGGIGSAIENAGNVAEVHAKAAESLALRTQTVDAENKLQALQLTLTHDPNTGAFTKRGQDAFNLTQQYMPKWNEGSQAILASVPDPRARLAVQQSIAHGGTALAQQLDSHEIQQHQQFAVQTAQDGIKIAAQNAAANHNNPDILAASRDRIEGNVDTLAMMNGWSAEQRDQAKQEAFSHLHADVIDRMLTDNEAQRALHYLNQFKGEMDASTAYSASRQIEAHLKEKQNEQKQDIADRFQDSMLAAQYGLTNPISVSRSELNVLYPKDAQRRWDGLQMIAAAGAQAKKYDTMTPGQIEADLEANRPTSGGPEAAFAIQGFQARAQAAQRSLQARQTDPAQFAIDSKAGWSELDFRNPQNMLQQLKSRANTQEQVSQTLGVQTPLLSKGEEKQLTAAFEKSTPGDRLNLINALHSVLPEERSYFSLMHQLQPHSPVTAIVGARAPVTNLNQAPVWYDQKYASNPTDSQRILTGEALLNPQGTEKEGTPKAKFPMPPDEGSSQKPGLRPAFSNLAGDLFRDRPELEEAHYQAYRDAYAALASEAGITSDTLNPSLAKQAAKIALGTTVSFNDRTVSVPSGMDPSRFDSIMRAAVDKRATALGAQAGFLDKIRGFQPVEIGAVGSGRYELVNGNAPLVNPGGKGIFVVDLRGQYLANRGAVPAPEDAARIAASHTSQLPPPTITAAPPIEKPQKLTK